MFKGNMKAMFLLVMLKVSNAGINCSDSAPPAKTLEGLVIVDGEDT